jgi:hypothetical protein
MKRVRRSLVKHMLDTGEPLRNLVERAVGKTTGAILQALATSYAKPGEWVLVDDPDVKLHREADHLLREVQAWVHAHRWEGIEVRRELKMGERYGPPHGSVQQPSVWIRNTFAEVLS